MTEETTKPSKFTLAGRDKVGIFLVLIFFLALGTLAVKSLQPKSYNPLGEYRQVEVGYDGFLTDDQGKPTQPPPKALLPQQVHGLDSFPILTVATGSETLPAHRRKCNNTTTNVTVTGEVRWHEVEPAGIVIPSSHGQGIRVPGCEDKDITLAIPPDMLARLQTLAASGTRTTVWRLEGEEAPISPDGNQFTVTKYWDSTDFLINYIGPAAEVNQPTTTTSVVAGL